MKTKSSKYRTPEEKLARKQEKQAAKIARTFGYTNDDNPFGDSNLTGRFVWKKKRQLEKTTTSSKSSGVSPLRKQEELFHEIRKVRQRREERLVEISEQERLKKEEAHLRDISQYEDWHKKEEDFHLAQARVRSYIRIREGREKPIDMIAKNVLLLSDDLQDLDIDKNKCNDIDIELREPYKLFNNLTHQQLEELRDDIAVYIELEGRGEDEKGRDKVYAMFWQSLMIVCKDEIEKIQQEKWNSMMGIHKEVHKDIEDMLQGKNYDELCKMEKEIEHMMNEKSGGIDAEYWEGVLRQLIVCRAKIQLKEMHETMLKKHLIKVEEQRNLKKEKEMQNGEKNDHHEEKKSLNRFSTSYDDSIEARKMYNAEEERGLDEEEEELGQSAEIEVSHRYYPWNDKYRPRKPRYYNRVKAGYDWNKYNQTHYDHDTPPPKTIQGYKFNVFYPDLMDKTKTPTFFLEKADSQDFMIIRFHAGPPYEDIAFKIVNREWECSHKRGFKSLFERGILYLHFDFKRLRYRR